MRQRMEEFGDSKQASNELPRPLFTALKKSSPLPSHSCYPTTHQPAVIAPSDAPNRPASTFLLGPLPCSWRDTRHGGMTYTHAHTGLHLVVLLLVVSVPVPHFVISLNITDIFVVLFIII